MSIYYACNLNSENTNPEKNVSEFINFLPVLAYDGSTMEQVNAQAILDTVSYTHLAPRHNVYRMPPESCNKPSGGIFCVQAFDDGEGRK